MLRLLIALVVNLIIVDQCYGYKYITLNSDNWSLHDEQNQYSLPKVTVPGDFNTHLHYAGLIDDVLYDQNHVTYRNFSKLNWIWSRQFKIDKADLEGPNDFSLIAQGIDTISSIYINGKLIGETFNMHIGYKFPIKDYLHAGDNTIEVKIQSPVIYAKKANDEYTAKYGYKIAPVGWEEKWNGIPHSSFMRKLFYSFSWDSVASGIWLPIGIEIIPSNKLHFEGFWSTLDESNDGNNWVIKTTVTLLKHYTGQEVDVHITLTADDSIDTNTYEKEFTVFESSLNLKADIKDYYIGETIIPKSRVSLWWPNGMPIYTSDGKVKQRPQTLYNMVVNIKSRSDSSIHQSKNKRIGFRTVKLIQEKPRATQIIDGKPHEVEFVGRSFRFEVNGLPIFMKGANMVPISIHHFNETWNKDYTKKLLSMASYSNLNMIRIWGGGVYQPDYFYDWADEMGLLVWQDFMFACLTFPTNWEFLDNVKSEVIQAVTRLGHHASIAIWNGNNENDQAIGDGWWPEVVNDKQRYIDDYLKLNRDTVKATLKQYDDRRAYIPSSPANGEETDIAGGYTYADPGDYKVGDTHFYYYKPDAWNIDNYPEARFITEYGFESYSSLSSFRKVIPENGLVYPLTKSLEARQHQTNGTLQMQAMIETYFGLPREMGTINTLKKIIYLSQCLQAYGFKLETDTFLRNRDLDIWNGMKWTSGALYWVLNDIWTTTSWAGIEFGGKWKMVQYYIKNGFNPIHGQIFTRIDYNTKVKMLDVVISNDIVGKVKVAVKLNAYHLDSFTPITIKSGEFEVDRYKAVTIWSSGFDETLISSGVCSNINDCLLQLEYKIIPETSGNDYDTKGEDFMFPRAPKELQLRDAKINIVDVYQVDKHEMKPLIYQNENYNVFKVKLTTNVPALFVWLDFGTKNDIDGIFSDNGFMMVKPEKEIYFQTYDLSVDANYIRNLLAVTHVKENMY